MYQGDCARCGRKVRTDENYLKAVRHEVARVIVPTQKRGGTLRSTAGSLLAHAALVTAQCEAAMTMYPRLRRRRGHGEMTRELRASMGFGG
jgi:hypothetical protein